MSVVCCELCGRNIDTDHEGGEFINDNFVCQECMEEEE